MAKFEDLKGQKFGYWTVVERAENHPATRRAQWFCECECGTKKIIRASASLKVLTYHFPPIISQTSHRLCECLFCCLCLYITICTVHVNGLLKKISKIMKKNVDKMKI